MDCALSCVGGNNLPKKSNIKGAKGLDALTGKGNFDIAEYNTINMIRIFSHEKAHLAFLIKNGVIKNIVLTQPKLRLPISAM